MNQRLDLVNQYTTIKIQDLLTVVVNYHVETIINQIIQILINNTKQTSHLHYLQIPPGVVMEKLVFNLSTVKYDTIKLQAIPFIISILQEKFVDSVITVNKQKTYISIDWTIA